MRAFLPTSLLSHAQNIASHRTCCPKKTRSGLKQPRQAPSQRSLSHASLRSLGYNIIYKYCFTSTAANECLGGVVSFHASLTHQKFISCLVLLYSFEYFFLWQQDFCMPSFRTPNLKAWLNAFVQLQRAADLLIFYSRMLVWFDFNFKLMKQVVTFILLVVTAVSLLIFQFEVSSVFPVVMKKHFIFENHIFLFFLLLICSSFLLIA